MTHKSATDTIAAIATPPGEGAIAIIRLSGPRALTIADQTFRCPAPPPSQRPAGTFIRGKVIAPDTGETLDTALLLIFKAPHSYTGENSVEIQCHGGTQTAQRILNALFSTGARQAEPGEFTKRAFLNDKMDLTQAEAVADLIHARSERAARLATAQLKDTLGQNIRLIYDQLLAEAADVEAMLDFADDELPQTVPTEISRRIEATKAQIQTLLATWQEGHVLREGARVVIAGAPNVGKSTLMNQLTGRNRVIVSPQPGTTRDTIEEPLNLQGYPIHLTDTAGLRSTTSQIEQEGIRRTQQALNEADLIIYMLDASQNLSTDEKNFLKEHKTSNILVLINKIDLEQVIFTKNLPDFDVLEISLKKEPKIPQICEKIVAKIVKTPPSSDSSEFAISLRHKIHLDAALKEIHLAHKLLQTASESDYLLAATHLRAAMEKIGHIFGKNCPEDLLNQIFSRFCVGK